ncbi:hypothetical protein B484DRAFT_446568 [Ochromonadaceae sp. CCMP2298]|nr:hypothetical protein B484DRAFT_446568 [Ochromonadaceae sp. CCMP2298]
MNRRTVVVIGIYAPAPTHIHKIHTPLHIYHTHSTNNSTVQYPHHMHTPYIQYPPVPHLYTIHPPYTQHNPIY